MIAGYLNKQLIAPFTVEGSCNRTVFETWLKECLIPMLKPRAVSFSNFWPKIRAIV
jgi:hypothetical protein